MNTVALDVHSEWCQMAVISDSGDVLQEMRVRSRAKDLRSAVKKVKGPKRIVFENGPLSGMLCDAFRGLAKEVVSCDVVRNALISRAEDSNDERDARRLGLLARAGAVHGVYVPKEPYRTLRSLTRYDHRLARMITALKNQVKALCRRQGIDCRGQAVYTKKHRPQFLEALPSAELRWQMESMYRCLDLLRLERVGVYRKLSGMARKIPVIRRIEKIPGMGPLTARVFVAWIVDPQRFKSRSALSSYAGLGLGQGISNWKVVGRARASKRGQRELKRVLFLAAKAAVQGDNAFGTRYRRRLSAGWEHRKAIRDVARRILLVAVAVWSKGEQYKDDKVAIPVEEGAGGS